MVKLARRTLTTACQPKFNYLVVGIAVAVTPGQGQSGSPRILPTSGSPPVLHPLWGTGFMHLENRAHPSAPHAGAILRRLN